MDAIFIMLKFEGLSHAVEVKVWEYKYREAFDCDSLRSSAARLPWTPCVEESKRQGTAVNVPIFHRSQSCPRESRLVAVAVRENNEPGRRPAGPDGELPVSAPTWAGHRWEWRRCAGPGAADWACPASALGRGLYCNYTGSASGSSSQSPPLRLSPFSPFFSSWMSFLLSNAAS